MKPARVTIKPTTSPRDAFELGAQAFLAGIYGAAPPKLSFAARREWERGWNTEYFANIKRLNNGNV